MFEISQVISSVENTPELSIEKNGYILFHPKVGRFLIKSENMKSPERWETIKEAIRGAFGTH